MRHGRLRPPIAANDDIAETVLLSRLESCEALEAHLEDRAVDELDAQIEARLDTGFDPAPPPRAVLGAPRLAGDAPFERVVGDRDRIYVLDAGRLRAVAIAPLAAVGSVPIEGAPLGVIPSGDRLFVLTQNGARTRITLLSREDLRIIGARELAGRAQQAIALSGGLTLVLAGGLRAAPALDLAEDRTEIATEAFKREQEDQIRSRTLDDWLEPDDLPRDCASFDVAGAPLYLGLTRMVVLDRELSASSRTLIGRVEISTADGGTVLLAAPHRWRLPRPGQVSHSYLFAFDTATLDPLATGGLEGTFSNGGALAIAGTDVRAVATIERRTSDPINAWGQTTQTHQIDRLRLAGGALDVVATSATFAADNPLLVVRFLEERTLAATGAHIYSVEDAHPDAIERFLLARPIDGLADAGGALLSISRDGELISVATLDPTALDRMLSARSIMGGSSESELTLSIDKVAHLVAVPEIGEATMTFPASPAVSVRVLAVDPPGGLASADSIDLTPLYAGRAEPPHLLFGLFVGGRAFGVSDAGVATLDESRPLAVLTLAFE